MAQRVENALARGDNVVLAAALHQLAAEPHTVSSTTLMAALAANQEWERNLEAAAGGGHDGQALRTLVVQAAQTKEPSALVPALAALQPLVGAAGGPTVGATTNSLYRLLAAQWRAAEALDHVQHTVATREGLVAELPVLFAEHGDALPTAVVRTMATASTTQHQQHPTSHQQQQRPPLHATTPTASTKKRGPPSWQRSPQSSHPPSRSPTPMGGTMNTVEAAEEKARAVVADAERSERVRMVEASVMDQSLRHTPIPKLVTRSPRTGALTPTHSIEHHQRTVSPLPNDRSLSVLGGPAPFNAVPQSVGTPTALATLCVDEAAERSLLDQHAMEFARAVALAARRTLLLWRGLRREDRSGGHLLSPAYEAPPPNEPATESPPPPPYFSDSDATPQRVPMAAMSPLGGGDARDGHASPPRTQHLPEDLPSSLLDVSPVLRSPQNPRTIHQSTSGSPSGDIKSNGSGARTTFLDLVKSYSTLPATRNAASPERQAAATTSPPPASSTKARSRSVSPSGKGQNSASSPVAIASPQLHDSEVNSRRLLHMVESSHRRELEVRLQTQQVLLSASSPSPPPAARGQQHRHDATDNVGPYEYHSHSNDHRGGVSDSSPQTALERLLMDS